MSGEGEDMVRYYPKNFIPVNGGGESLVHFVLRCLFCKAVYERNREYRKVRRELLVESEKRFFEKMKHRSREIEFIKFIDPDGLTEAEEFEELLESVWREIQNCIIVE